MFKKYLNIRNYMKKNFFKDNKILNRDYNYRYVDDNDVERLVSKYGDVGGEIYVNAIGLYNMYIHDINHDSFDELQNSYALLKQQQSLSSTPELYIEDLSNIMYNMVLYANLLSHLVDDIESVIISCLRHSPHVIYKRTSNVDRLFPIYNFSKFWVNEENYKKLISLKGIISQHTEYLKLPECCFKPKIRIS